MIFCLTLQVKTAVNDQYLVILLTSMTYLAIMSVGGREVL